MTMGSSNNSELSDRRRLLGCLLALGVAAMSVTSALPAFGKDGGSDGGSHGGSDGGGHDGDDGGSGGHGRNGGRNGGRDDDGGEDRGKENDDRGRESHSVERFLERIKARGIVASTIVSGDSIEVHYIDGWSEAVDSGRYRLRDASRRVVTERAARRSDYRRLNAAVSASR